LEIEWNVEMNGLSSFYSILPVLMFIENNFNENVNGLQATGTGTL